MYLFGNKLCKTVTLMRHTISNNTNNTLYKIQLKSNKRFKCIYCKITLKMLR